jgi:type II secretory ATPase GspE/PulE/Tfp pilus assembly ATPase PilB-like protein
MSQLPVLVRREAPTQPEMASECAPVVRLQKMIFEEAASVDASDIHIEPANSVTRVRYRVNGVLTDTREVPRWMHDSLVSRIKILAKLDISERRLPQDGHIQAGDETGMDVRVSVLPSRWGEKVVIRMLRRGRSLLTLTQLGCSSETGERLHALIRRPQGMLLVVGPTGSGKTTTLYALINEIRNQPINVVTIEDPIEYEVDRLTQVQVQEKAGLSFARALRSILRQDPDVILVGEIRDSETAQTAFHAAITGHLVLSTVHATDAVSALLRVRELGVDRGLVASSLIAVVGQRLVRENCRACAEPEYPRPIYLELLGIAGGDAAHFRRSPGCPQCHFGGTRGRLGVYELLEIRGEVRASAENGSEGELRNVALGTGMKTITQQAVELVASGRVSVEEAYRTCYFGGE